MADFCKQCTEYYFGKGKKNDLSGFSTKKDTKKGVYVNVLCEGCGFTWVDHNGKCVANHEHNERKRSKNA